MYSFSCIISLHPGLWKCEIIGLGLVCIYPACVQFLIFKQNHLQYHLEHLNFPLMHSSKHNTSINFSVAVLATFLPDLALLLTVTVTGTTQGIRGLALVTPVLLGTSTAFYLKQSAAACSNWDWTCTGFVVTKIKAMWEGKKKKKCSIILGFFPTFLFFVSTFISIWF